jgi:hypothetical protein
MTIKVFIQNEADFCWKHYYDEKTREWKRTIKGAPVSVSVRLHRRHHGRGRLHRRLLP